MGIRVEVKRFDIAAALRKLNGVFWENDCCPSGQRNRWYKRRRDFYQKPSVLRHRRKGSIYRKKHGPVSCSYIKLDGWDYGPYPEG